MKALLASLFAALFALLAISAYATTPPSAGSPSMAAETQTPVPSDDDKDKDKDGDKKKTD